jgi:hypothetical protein
VDLLRPNLSFLAEAQPRLENRRGQKALFDRGDLLHFLDDRTNNKAKDIGKRWRHGQRPKKCVTKRITFRLPVCE